jgi:lipopolysaccharide transport system ATP-binding protein
MSDTAIRVLGLGKQYRIGAPQERYSTLRDQVQKWTSVRGLLRRAARAERRPLFWALKDVSFEVKRGEVVGVIGRNGAGKSTLLKILSRITEPTEGEAQVHGRVGSLLEVGTGFHPELTGRENVYLNGAILGMKRAEITRKFDEIVAFAEVEKFIDTPAKHYSSGMYMRLAFAVAAHLDPEILIVDEVLAVGDAEFQKRCLGKMGDIARGGRTVLFVSHNLSAVQALCTRAAMLKGGRLVQEGPVGRVLTTYSTDRSGESAQLEKNSRSLGSGLTLERIGIAPAEPTCIDRISVEFELASELDRTSLSDLCLILYNANDIRVGVVDFRPQQPPYGIRFARRLVVRCELEPTRLVEGDYRFSLYAVCTAVEMELKDVLSFTIRPRPSLPGSAGDTFVKYPAQYRGTVQLDFAVTRFEAGH